MQRAVPCEISQKALKVFANMTVKVYENFGHGELLTQPLDPCVLKLRQGYLCWQPKSASVSV
jgi:hypothetical protein